MRKAPLSPSKCPPKPLSPRSLSPAASANPRRPLAMTACFSLSPITLNRSASPRSSSTRLAWPDLASRSRLDL